MATDRPRYPCSRTPDRSSPQFVQHPTQDLPGKRIADLVALILTELMLHHHPARHFAGGYLSGCSIALRMVERTRLRLGVEPVLREPTKASYPKMDRAFHRILERDGRLHAVSALDGADRRRTR
jgi:hypothetical protein